MWRIWSRCNAAVADTVTYRARPGAGAGAGARRGRAPRAPPAPRTCRATRGSVAPVLFHERVVSAATTKAKAHSGRTTARATVVDSPGALVCGVAVTATVADA